jgi:hypothetical protein
MTVKSLLLIGAIFSVLLALLVFGQRNRTRKVSADETYLGLRSQALHASRERLHLAETSDQRQPWGVVMDWGIERGTATVVAFSDGPASVYLSSGGGYIGGNGEERIRRAAQQAVSVAGEYQAEMVPSQEYPLPAKGEVIFYVLTDTGVLTSRASEEDLANDRHRLSKLGKPMQAIISAYRQLQ